MEPGDTVLGGESESAGEGWFRLCRGSFPVGYSRFRPDAVVFGRLSGKRKPAVCGNRAPRAEPVEAQNRVFLYGLVLAILWTISIS